MLKYGDMTSGDAYDRLRTALRAELQKNFGRIREIEIALGRSEGYLSRFCRGETSIPVDMLLRSLELLNADLGQFFNQALGGSADSGMFLDEIAGPPNKSLAQLQKTTLRLAVDADGVEGASGIFDVPWDTKPKKTAKLVEAVLHCSGIEQRRRLRTAKRYRTLSFAEAFLDRIDDLRYENPKDALKQAEVVGCDLIPEIPGDQPLERLALVLRAIGIWSSGQRILGDLEQAAAGLHFVLGVAQRFLLHPITADTLRRGAYVLGDHALFQPAQQLLGEALVLFHELDDEEEVAKIQLERGIFYNRLGDHLLAARAIQKALRRLPERTRAQRRYRLAGYQGLAEAYECAGDLESSERWLEQALASFRDEGSITRAKVIWQLGNLAHRYGDLEQAEERLREAREELLRCESEPEVILVNLDLTRVLLDLGKSAEAVELARGMAAFLGPHHSNQYDRATLVEFVRAAMEGQLNMALVERYSRELRTTESSLRADSFLRSSS